MVFGLATGWLDEHNVNLRLQVLHLVAERIVVKACLLTERVDSICDLNSPITAQLSDNRRVISTWEVSLEDVNDVLDGVPGG